MNELKKNNKWQLENKTVDNEIAKEDFDLLVKDVSNRELIFDRLVYKYTLKELANRYNTTIGKIRKQLDNSINEICCLLGV